MASKLSSLSSIIKYDILKIKKKTKFQEGYVRSEAEDVIAEFFEEETIDYEEQVQIILEHDVKSFRIVDFYLPQYKVYVEFLGKWNDEKCKDEYKQKIAHYKRCSIPCIYFYPDNLGALNFLFKRRMRKVLKEHKMWYQLFKFNWNELIKNKGLGIGMCIGLFYYFRNDPTRWVIVLGVYAYMYGAIKTSFYS